jgi:hypothetical protein
MSPKGQSTVSIQSSPSNFFLILRAALTTFPLVMIPTNLPELSTTGNLRYLVSRSNLAASSRLVVSRTTRGADVITSPMTFPLVLLKSFCISLNVYRVSIHQNQKQLNTSRKKTYINKRNKAYTIVDRQV